MLLREEQFNSFFTYTCFYCFPMQFWQLLKFLGTMWLNWGNMKETTSFILKFCFFIYIIVKGSICWKLLMLRILKKWTRLNNIYFKSNFKEILAAIYTPQNYRSHLFLFLLVSSFFAFVSAGAFMRKLLVDCSFKSLALLWVIHFFCPLVKRKGAKRISKYLILPTLNFCNKWCDIP